MKGLLLSLGLVIVVCGCRRDYATKPEMGPHGVVTVKKIPYTPEQVAAREAREHRPLDANLGEIEKVWPKLTESQRADLVRSAKQMAQQP